jgi:hypothetical protein
VLDVFSSPDASGFPISPIRKLTIVDIDEWDFLNDLASSQQARSRVFQEPKSWLEELDDFQSLAYQGVRTFQVSGSFSGGAALTIMGAWGTKKMMSKCPGRIT